MKKIALADLYRLLKKYGYSDEDSIANLCRETEFLEIDEKQYLI